MSAGRLLGPASIRLRSTEQKIASSIAVRMLAQAFTVALLTLRHSTPTTALAAASWLVIVSLNDNAHFIVGSAEMA